jgi:solute carrier family 8 (sodium/calcium exchanger)
MLPGRIWLLAAILLPSIFAQEDDDGVDLNDPVCLLDPNWDQKYDSKDELCPCGKSMTGMCKSGLFIPLWKNGEINKWIEMFVKWQNDDFENGFANIKQFTKRNPMNEKIGKYADQIGFYFIERKDARGNLEKIDEDDVGEEGIVYSQEGMMTKGETALRGFVYVLGLIYFFIGVSIVADRFMSSIEVITSQEKEVRVKKSNGEYQTITVRIWNETVSNLTLMALGSSAPEILLSVIETCGAGLRSGDLGPSTIVGSASFNLFVIIAICIYVIPDGEVRKIKHLRVFFVTALWSVLAYIWMYFIIVSNTPSVVEPWEAILTLLFFPLLVIWAWVADKRLLVYDLVYKKYQKGKGNMIVEKEGAEDDVIHMKDAENFGDSDEADQREMLLGILRKIRKDHPNATAEELENLANTEMIRKEHKSRAFYRIQATRMMTGGGDIVKAKIDRVTDAKSAAGDISIAPSGVTGDEDADPTMTRVQFNPKDYRVMENCGNAELVVVRSGADIERTVFVDYKTLDGSASAGGDFEYAEGTLCFKSGETHKKVHVSVIDDEVFEEDEHFLVMLSNLRVCDDSGALQARGGIASKFEIGKNKTATVTILDDDHRGNFAFEMPKQTLHENCGSVEIQIVRKSGARGRVFVPFRTVEGSATGNGHDFDDCEGELLFENEETEKSLTINIVDDEQYEKNKNFFIELGEPRVADQDYLDIINNTSGTLTEEQIDVARQGAPKLEEDGKKMEIEIIESYEFKNTIDKMVKKTNLSILVSTASWREQFIDAFQVMAGDDEEEGGDEEAEPGLVDYIMHYLTLPWKILFAFVPPTDYAGGWWCFVISISMVGLLTAFIGDLASHFGCTCGVNDAVTAISFVALGTSVPDTFASKVAAIGDEYADASVGNVTGSNAVNVFLGIGVAWSIAAVYWAWMVPEDQRTGGLEVKEGTLTFSVIVFCAEAVIAILVLLFRRRYGGELGGPRGLKIGSALFFLFLWFFYLGMSIAKSYCFL